MDANRKKEVAYWLYLISRYMNYLDKDNYETFAWVLNENNISDLILAIDFFIEKTKEIYPEEINDKIYPRIATTPENCSIYFEFISEIAWANTEEIIAIYQEIGQTAFSQLKKAIFFLINLREKIYESYSLVKMEKEINYSEPIGVTHANTISHAIRNINILTPAWCKELKPALDYFQKKFNEFLYDNFDRKVDTNLVPAFTPVDIAGITNCLLQIGRKSKKELLKYYASLDHASQFSILLVRARIEYLFFMIDKKEAKANESETKEWFNLVINAKGGPDENL